MGGLLVMEIGGGRGRLPRFLPLRLRSKGVLSALVCSMSDKVWLYAFFSNLQMIQDRFGPSPSTNVTH